jgi:ethanolamine utilization protein EutP (predicted NTPase)
MRSPLLVPNTTDTPFYSPEDFFSMGESAPAGDVFNLDELIVNLPPNASLPFTTQGRVTSAKLLKQLLAKTGTANVYITSWSITQGAVQQLVNLLDSKAISNIKIILDSRAPKHWPEAFQLLSMNVPQLRLAKCHAKLIVVQNDEHSILIISSLNWSEQHSRFEAGFISTAPLHVNKVIADIEKLYSKANAWN